MTGNRFRLWVQLVFGVLVLFLVGCSAPAGEAPAPTTEPTATEMATATSEPTPAPTATAEPTASPTTAPTATPEPTPEPTATPQPLTFAHHGEASQAVLPSVEEGVFATNYTDPGAVVYHDGQFHMFYNSFQGWPAEVNVGYATSPDGIEWTRAGDEPVFSLADTDYETFTLLASSALVEDDGTWVLYFYTWDDKVSNASGGIGRATAPDPTGPWTAEADLLLTPDDDRWDGRSLRSPSVVRDGDGYVMYYAGGGPRSSDPFRIGMATSPDGITWTKYDDPATTDDLFAMSDPVLDAGPEDAWDERWVQQPKVQQTPAGFVMTYRSMGIGATSAGYGYAVSEDGLNWTRPQEAPIVAVSDYGSWNGAWFHDYVYHDGTHYLFVEVGQSGGTTVHLATYEGSLFP